MFTYRHHRRRQSWHRVVKSQITSQSRIYLHLLLLHRRRLVHRFTLCHHQHHRPILHLVHPHRHLAHRHPHPHRHHPLHLYLYPKTIHNVIYQ